MRRRIVLLSPGLLLACAAPPSPVQTLPPLRPPEGGRHWRLDLAHSRLRIVVFRAGPAARLGHHHLIEAGDADGALWLPERGIADAQGEIRVPLAALRLDEAAWRRDAGGEFDERPVGDDDIAATRRNLLALLQADAHPQVLLRLRQLGGSAPHVVATLALQIAGRLSEQRVALDWRERDGSLHVSGRLPLSLRALGLVAPSVLGGLLSVADDVVLDAQLRFVPAPS